MAEKKSDNKPLTFEDVCDKINKDWGKGSILTALSKPECRDVISTGSLKLDIATGIGGLARGTIVELSGWESCIAADTYIKFIIVEPRTGRVQDCKGQSIENLHKRFHKIHLSHFNADKTMNSEYYVMGINEKGRIIRNRVADVVFTGTKECFKIETSTGFTLEATADHKFFAGNEYKRLVDLKEGDTIYIHNNTTYKGRNKTIRHAQEHVKYYYKNKLRVINRCTYYRVDRCRLVYEAHMNNISLEEYRSILNSGISKLPQNWWTIPDGMHIHHEDENSRNDNISNLILIDPSSHGKIHAKKKQDNLRFVCVPDRVIKIEKVGERETYDIKCFYPYNNYVASGFIVHNSGKSTIAMNVLAETQKRGLKAVLIDAEHAFDKKYAKALGVDVDKLIISQPDYAEAGYGIAISLMETGEVGAIVIDSQTALQPKKVMENEIGSSNLGLHAKLMSEVVLKIINVAARYNVLVIFISQFREKIGVMFGSPITTNGGNALKFYAQMRIEFWKTLEKEDDTAFANKTTCKIIKNKLASPHEVAKFRIIFGQGVDRVEEIIELAVEYNVLKKAGSWFSYGESNSIAQGEYKLIELFNSNPEFYKEVEDKVLEKIKK